MVFCDIFKPMFNSKKRLFIAINLPKNIKKNIVMEIEKFRYNFTNDVRFLEPENWHITLVFLGYQPEENLPAILEAMEETSQQFSVQEIEFAGISYGPIAATPRMVWLNGSEATSKSLSVIKEFLENALVDKGIRFQRESRGFKAHITLARFSQIAKKDLPEIEKKVDWNFLPETLDLMESHLSRNGAKYEQIGETKFLR